MTRCMSGRDFEINGKTHFTRVRDLLSRIQKHLKFKNLFVLSLFSLYYDKQYIVHGFRKIDFSLIGLK